MKNYANPTIDFREDVIIFKYYYMYGLYDAIIIENGNGIIIENRNGAIYQYVKKRNTFAEAQKDMNSAKKLATEAPREVWR